MNHRVSFARPSLVLTLSPPVSFVRYMVEDKSYGPAITFVAALLLLLLQAIFSNFLSYLLI